jgi:cell division cycle 20-like protein 1, cofactor of APC complex
MSSSKISAQCSSQKKKKFDRFIPHSVARALFASDEKSTRASNYQEFLGQNLFAGSVVPKILKFGDEGEEKENSSPNTPLLEQARPKRQKLPQQPYRVLPAASLKDDFYLNLLDWADSGHIAVGLQSSLYLWSGCASRVTKMREFREEGESLCGLSFQSGGSRIALGLSRGDVTLLDIEKQKEERYEAVHLGRIGSVGCTSNLICSGGRDGYVSIRDIRQADEIYRYRAHYQEICGLKLSPAGDMVATGGNDNKLHLFSLKKMETLAEWGDHRAAVKALGFNPSDPTIVSGGGSADRRLRVYSLQTLQLLNEVDTGSQVCNLAYSPISSQLVTTHGYSLNELTLWNWGPNGRLEKVDSVMGHRRRVLYLAGEARGGRVVTGAGDEQLHLWKAFDESRGSESSDLR